MSLKVHRIVQRNTVSLSQPRLIQTWPATLFQRISYQKHRWNFITFKSPVLFTFNPLKLSCKMVLHDSDDELQDQNNKLPAARTTTTKRKMNSSPLTYLFPITFILLILLLPFCLLDDFPASLNFLRPSTTYVDGKCDLSIGKWVRNPSRKPYYTNSSCYWIIPQHNCLKFGRPETEYLNWRWKPDGCELAPFDPVQFLNLVRGKSMAFVGDSVSRNQMQSLLCILSSVSHHSSFS